MHRVYKKTNLTANYGIIILSQAIKMIRKNYLITLLNLFSKLVGSKFEFRSSPPRLDQPIKVKKSGKDNRKNKSFN